MRWKPLSKAAASLDEEANCNVCGEPIAESTEPGIAFRPDFEHGDTPASLEFLEERHSIDLGDERGVVCGRCRQRVDELLG